MARTALAAASIALLSLFALAPTAQAATSATIVIQTAPPPVHYEATPVPGAAWSGCRATGNGAMTATAGSMATGSRRALATATTLPSGLNAADTGTWRVRPLGTAMATAFPTAATAIVTAMAYPTGTTTPDGRHPTTTPPPPGARTQPP